MQALRQVFSYVLLMVMGLAITPADMLHDCDHEGHHSDQATFSAAFCDICDHAIGPVLSPTQPEQVSMERVSITLPAPWIREASLGFELLASDRGPPGSWI